MCLRNTDAAASLDIHKIYPIIPDARALERGLLRIVDESGKDYLYPSDHFSEIKLPPKLAKAIAARAMLSQQWPERPGGQRAPFGEAYRRFLKTHPLREIGAEGVFDSIRDRGLGRRIPQ